MCDQHGSDIDTLLHYIHTGSNQENKVTILGDISLLHGTEIHNKQNTQFNLTFMHLVK